jgi:hypothetical protein
MPKLYSVTLPDEDVEIVAYRALEGKHTEDDAVMFALRRDLSRDRGQVDRLKAELFFARYNALDAAGKQVVDTELAKAPVDDEVVVVP